MLWRSQNDRPGRCLPIIPFCVLLVVTCSAVHAHTDSPIIGVLTTPLTSSGCVTLAEKQPGEIFSNGGSCFHSLYVKWIESAGGRVVPILYDSPASAVEQLFGSLNGVLFTGGETNVSALESQYMRTAGLLLNLTVEAKARGQHVPLWGTCMGIQTLSVLTSGDPSVLQLNVFDSESLMLPLDLPAPSMINESRLLRALPAQVVDWLTTENVTVNLHHDGVSPETYRQNQRLSDFFRIVSTNYDRKGRPFVSTVEGVSVPVYGAQWHPERPQFEFSRTAGEDRINHDPHAIMAMQAISNFFIGEARRNSRRFPTEREEGNRLIYNYVPTVGDSYQAYIFPPVGHAGLVADGRSIIV